MLTKEGRVYNTKIAQGMRFAVDAEHECVEMYTEPASSRLMRYPRDRNVVYAYPSDPRCTNSFEAKPRINSTEASGLDYCQLCHVGGPEQHISSLLCINR